MVFVGVNLEIATCGYIMEYLFYWNCTAIFAHTRTSDLSLYVYHFHNFFTDFFFTQNFLIRSDVFSVKKFKVT